MDALGIYLKDQLALGVLWRELARRAERSNRGTPLGEALAQVARGIAEDVATFDTLMRRLGVPPSQAKIVLAMAAERLARLKPNGRLFGYAPLSRFVELEFLVMGIEGKKQLWATLGDLADLRSRLPDMDVDALIDRAQRQRDQLEPFRTAAGKTAFGGDDVRASPAGSARTTHRGHP